MRLCIQYHIQEIKTKLIKCLHIVHNDVITLPGPTRVVTTHNPNSHDTIEIHKRKRCIRCNLIICSYASQYSFIIRADFVARFRLNVSKYDLIRLHG